MSVISNSIERPVITILDGQDEPRSINDKARDDIKEQGHAFFDATKPLVATALKVTSNIVVLAATSSAGIALKASVAASYPELSQTVNVAIDASTGLAVGLVDQVVSPQIDYSVEKSTNVAKDSFDKSVDTFADTSNYSFSFFKK